MRMRLFSSIPGFCGLKGKTPHFGGSSKNRHTYIGRQGIPFEATSCLYVRKAKGLKVRELGEGSGACVRGRG